MLLDGARWPGGRSSHPGKEAEMEASRHPLLAGACAVLLLAGCAQTGPQAGSPTVRIEPVYRVHPPVGTAAGQYAVGRIDLGEGRYEAAIKRFRQALQLDPTLVEAHNGLGVAFGQTGRFAEAAEAFRAALASGPAAAHVLNNLGFAQLKAGQLDEAWRSLRRSYDLEPTNARTRENIALLAEARRIAVQGEAQQAPLVATRTTPFTAVAETRATTVSEAAAPPTAAPAGQLAKVENHAASTVEQPSSMEPTAIAELAVSESTAAETTVVEATTAESLAAASEPFAEPLQAAPADVITAVAQASAAMVLGEAPNPLAYEIVLSRTSDASLVQLSPNVYELRRSDAAIAQAGASLTAPVAASAVPLPRGAKPVEPASAVARAPAPAAAVASRVAVTPVPMRKVVSRVATAPEVAYAARPAARRVAADAKVLTAPAPALVSLAAIDGLEVSNGVGLRSLAGRTARQLERFGVSVARVSDYQTFGKGRTEVHYRAGHLEGAKAVQQRLPVDAKLVKASKMHPGVNVRLVVGRDMVVGPIAWWSDMPAVAESAMMAYAAPVAVEQPIAQAEPVGFAPIRSEPMAIAMPRGLDLKPFAGKVARANVDDGWRQI
jgi:tetratricopeptide (TPR) repeat protein